MNLAIFFNPVPETVFSTEVIPSEWQNNIRIFHETFPSLEDAEIALIGLTEERGAPENEGVALAADAVRQRLYKLKKGTGAYNIVDLGNLRNGEKLEETYLRLKEVCQTLMEQNIIPVLIGGSHDLDYGQFLAYEGMEKAITVLGIDCKIDMEPTELSPAQSHLEKIITHNPNYLFHYSHLGYQSFLVDMEKLEALEKLYFELYRIGQIKESLTESEPVIRTADMISFDMSAIKMADAPGNVNAQPFGFTGEEACQLCWYAGINSRMSSIGFYEYNPNLDQRDQTASVLATMIWYFVEGFYHRNTEIDITNSRFTKYNVSLKEHPHKLIFYKDTLTDKWWMEVPYPEGKSKFSRNTLVPCSYKDYKDACNGDIPNRWILTHAKLS